MPYETFQHRVMSFLSGLQRPVSWSFKGSPIDNAAAWMSGKWPTDVQTYGNMPRRAD
jgi:hypothetical protein